MIIRDDDTRYDYIYTHMDDFKVVARDPTMWIDRITTVFLVQEHGPRNYYLGNDYTHHNGQDIWTSGV